MEMATNKLRSAPLHAFNYNTNWATYIDAYSTLMQKFNRSGYNGAFFPSTAYSRATAQTVR